MAGFWTRFWAFGIDILVIGLSSHIALGLVWPDGLNTHIMQAYILYNGLFPGIWGAMYLILMTGFFAQTLGKMVIGIKVIPTDGGRLKWSTVLARELLGRPLSQLLGTYLGYLLCVLHPRKQAVHDLISDTCVVHDPEIKRGRWINMPAGPMVDGDHR